MKVRAGFVSNSSSSSFIVLIPNNFDIQTINFEKYKNEYCYSENEDIIKAFRKLKRTGSYCEGDDYMCFNILGNILEEFLVCDSYINTSNEIVSINKNKINKILKTEKKWKQELDLFQIQAVVLL